MQRTHPCCVAQEKVADDKEGRKRTVAFVINCFVSFLVGLVRRHGVDVRDALHGSAKKVCKLKIAAFASHSSVPQPRCGYLATTARGVCAYDALRCREKMHVPCGPSNPTHTDPSATA